MWAAQYSGRKRMIEAGWLTLALSLGILSYAVGLPPLVGHLLAGFLASFLAQTYGIQDTGHYVLSHLSHIGVLLLLFAIGLKIDFKSILRSHVLGTGLVHFFISTFTLYLGLQTFLALGVQEAFILAAGLSFSSTVLSAKVLESKRELNAYHGRLAIGVLVLQDLMALAVMILLAPGPSQLSLWTFSLILLPLLRPLLLKVMDVCREDELLLMFGAFLAVALGGFGFEVLGLSSELGALVFGVLVGPHKKSAHLGKLLWSLKEILLVGFFLEIGLKGVPSFEDFKFACALLLLLPVKGFLFFVLFTRFGLRARTSFLSALSLTAYSEFALIVSSVVLESWLTPLALCVALSFVLSAPFNNHSHSIYEKLFSRLLFFERNTRHPDEQPIKLNDAEVLIMGMGRTGSSAYERLKEKFKVRVMDSDPARVDLYKQRGIPIFYGDAEDYQLWEKLDLSYIKGVLLCFPDQEAKMESLLKLRSRNFKGVVAGQGLNHEEAQSLKKCGADEVYLTFSEAGHSLADYLLEHKSFQNQGV
jgi:predicted Kef-type K+ transport protein